jgi:hypothetical protein
MTERTDAELIQSTDPSQLSDAELRRLSVLSASAQIRIEEQLQALRAPPSRNYSLLLDSTRWKEVLLDHPDVFRGEQFLRQYFRDALKNNHAADGMAQALVHLMDLYVALPNEEPHLLAAARRLLAELVVANSAANGMKTTALKTIRSVLVQEEMPSNMVRAMEQARIAERLSQPDRHQPTAEKGS